MSTSPDHIKVLKQNLIRFSIFSSSFFLDNRLKLADDVQVDFDYDDGCPGPDQCPTCPCPTAWPPIQPHLILAGTNDLPCGLWAHAFFKHWTKHMAERLLEWPRNRGRGIRQFGLFGSPRPLISIGKLLHMGYGGEKQASRGGPL